MKKKIILVVDDDPAMVEVLKTRLEANNYQVTTASDGMLALEEVRRNKPDLIISDVKMPNVDGYAFCRTLSAEKETKDIPVILLTSYREAQEIKKGMDLGAVSFVQKPYKSEVLLSIVQGVIRGRA